MNDKEMIEHELIKNVIKMGIINNQSLNLVQKQEAMNRVDIAAQKADWFVELLRQCGYLE